MGPSARAMLIALLAAALVTAVRPAVAEELPVWPHEQQALLRQTEDKLIDVQRQLFMARQLKDQDAIAKLGSEFKSLQDKRRVLVEHTAGQLPSE